MIVIYARNVKQGTEIDREKWQSGQRKKVNKAGFNGRFRWYVKPVLGDCAKPYLPGTCGGKWRLYHGQPDKSPPIVRRYLDLPHLEYSYHNRYKHQILDASLSLPLTENIQIDMLKRPRPNIGRCAGTCEKCEADFYEIEPESEGDDDWKIESMLWNETKPTIVGYSEQHEPFANKGSGEFNRYTHPDYLKVAYKRCLVEIQRLPIDCPYPKKKSCVGCDYAIKTSYQDREGGAEYLPSELSWPKTCYNTFSDIPYINPYQVESDLGISNFLKKDVLEFLKSYAGIDVEGPTSAPSVKKRRENTFAHWDLRSYVPTLDEDPRKLYMGTPIGDLIAAAPDPGSHALYDLYSYARLSNDLISTKKFKLYEPTHKNLIKLFDLQRPGSGTGAEYCKLLVRHGVLRVVKRFLSRETWLYYSQKNQRPSPGALGWNNNAPTSEEIPRIGAINGLFAVSRG